MTNLTSANYKPGTRGQITRLEAGIIYKAVKNNQITTRAPFTGMLYDQAKLMVEFATDRYNQHSMFYDRIEYLVKAILDEDFAKAQELVNQIETALITGAGRKSPWAAFQNEMPTTSLNQLFETADGEIYEYNDRFFLAVRFLDETNPDLVNIYKWDEDEAPTNNDWLVNSRRSWKQIDSFMFDIGNNDETSNWADYEEYVEAVIDCHF